MNTKLSLIATLFCILLGYSCQKGDLHYSCNPQIDQWAKDNYENIQNFTKIEFESLNNGEQKAAYAIMGTKQRHALWMAKLNDVLQLEWTPQEAEHIKSLILFVEENKSLFADNETEDDRNKFELFMYVWIEYSKETLKWDKETIYSICGDPNNAIMIKTRYGHKKLTISRSYEIGQSTLKTRSESGGTFGDCTCSQESDWCDIFGEMPSSVMSCNNNNHNCNVVRNNCGTFWKFDCNGICKSPIA